ncbi:protein tramtrack, beta isoform-like isoform X3 [Scylla paramamosain]|uniref:protein tramtrack, beta isoform-like isoform X3 n=1 Tax=Scylla paramamosain TaxID=85552 RepID=UPI003082CB46
MVSLTNQARCYHSSGTMSEQCYCLRWNNYQSSVVGVLRSLLEEGQFVDVTLACDGRRLKAHKLMLSACSNFFRELLRENPSDHPIVFLRDVRFWELESIMDFIYNGQLFCGEGGRLPEHYYLGGGAEVGDLHQPPPLKRPRRPPPPTHTLLPPRPENPTPVSKLDDLPSKAAMAPTTPAQGSPKTSATTSDPSRSDPATATAAPGTTALSASTPSGVTTSPKGASVGERPGGLVKMEEDRTSTPTDAESDTEFGTSEGTGISGVDTGKDGDWGMGESPAPLSLNLNYSDGGFPVCKVCGKVFKHQGSLVAHYQVHQLRTKCPVCKKVLSRHYHMKVHLLTVHKVPDAEIEGLLRSQNIA